MRVFFPTCAVHVGTWVRMIRAIVVRSAGVFVFFLLRRPTIKTRVSRRRCDCG